MSNDLENKLLHFFTSGNIIEDFAASRAKKTARLRLAVRICFYAHCAAAVLCVTAAVILGAGAGIAAIAVCELILAAMSFMAAGGTKLLKILLFSYDFAFAAGMITAAVLLETPAPYTVTGIVSAVMGFVALAAFFASRAKSFIESFPPTEIRREHYTMLPDLGGSSKPSSSFLYDIPDMPDEEELKLILPPKRTEMQELSDKLREILCKPDKKGSTSSTSSTGSVGSASSADSLRTEEKV